MPDINKIEQELAAANRIIVSLNPLVIAFEGLAALVIQIAHRTGTPVQTFEQAYADFSAKRDGLKAALDEFHTKYPTEPQPPTM